MKKVLILLALVAVAFVSLPANSQAVGFGMYVEGASGDGEFEYEPNGSFDIDAESKGFGLVFDTNPSGPGIFSYRLNLGYEELELPDSSGDSLDLDGYVATNTFGFALVRKPTFRWWIGPQIKVGIYDGTLSIPGSGDYDLVAFGIGGATGFNIISDNLNLSITLGVQQVAYAGETNEFGPVQDINAETSTGFLNLAVLFGR